MSNCFKRLKEIKALPETLKKVEKEFNGKLENTKLNFNKNIDKIVNTEKDIKDNIIKLTDTLNSNIVNLNNVIEKLEKEVSILQNKVSHLNNPTKTKSVIKFSNVSNNPDPSFAYEKDSAFDVCAWINEKTEEAEFDEDKKEYFITLNSSEHRLINTGLRFELFDGVEMQVRTRSGCANKYGLLVMNTPGTVDNQYRGNILINAWNTSKKKMRIYNGERIAQCAICPVMYEGTFNLKKVEKIEENTKRSAKGIGSTGM